MRENDKEGSTKEGRTMSHKSRHVKAGQARQPAKQRAG